MTAPPSSPAMPPSQGDESGRTCRDSADAHHLDWATAGDADAVAAALSDAFTHYPFTDWAVPADNRNGRLRGLFSLTVARVGIPYGDTFLVRCAAPGLEQGVVGAVVGIPPAGAPDEVWASLASEEAALLAHRAEASAQADEATRHLRPSEPHYTVATIGVAPHHRRRGFAKALLEPVLAIADKQALPTYLETSSADNVRFYERIGFTVLDAVTLPDGGPVVWAMSRLPAP